MTKLTPAQQEQIWTYLVDCRQAQKSTTVEGICYHLDLPANIYDLRAVRAEVRRLGGKVKLVSGVRYMAA